MRRFTKMCLVSNGKPIPHRENGTIPRVPPFSPMNSCREKKRRKSCYFRLRLWQTMPFEENEKRKQCVWLPWQTQIDIEKHHHQNLFMKKNVTQQQLKHQPPSIWPNSRSVDVILRVFFRSSCWAKQQVHAYLDTKRLTSKFSGGLWKYKSKRKTATATV